MAFRDRLARLNALRLRFVAALAAAVLYFTGFCGLDQFYLSWICLVPMLWALDDEGLSFKEVLLLSWFFGTVTHMGGYTWITGMLVKFAYLPLPLALLGFFLLCLAQGSLLAAWGVLTHRLVFKYRVPLVIAAPVAMVACEWIYPALFPSYLSNSQYLWTTFIQTADIWGLLGLTFILTLSSSVIYACIDWLARHRRPAPTRALAAFVALFAFDLVYGVLRLRDVDDSVAHAERQLRIGLVQTNMGMYEKHQNPMEGLRRHREQSVEVIRQGAELVVWPESGYNMPIRDGVKNLANDVLGPIDKPLLFGGLRVQKRAGEPRKIYNSALLTNGAGDLLGTYDKTFLLAFGEYLPLGDTFPWLYELSPQSSHFDRGNHTQPLELDGIKLGILICYEDILPGFTREVAANEPHILVNMTNDVWFGRSREPYIHMALAAFRAVEHRRFLLRATNTGVSAIIDPAGRIVDQTPIFARANLIGDIAALEGRTLYSRLGDWPGWLSVVLLAYWMRAGLRRVLTREKPAASAAA